VLFPVFQLPGRFAEPWTGSRQVAADAHTDPPAASRSDGVLSRCSRRFAVVRIEACARVYSLLAELALLILH